MHWYNNICFHSADGNKCPVVYRQEFYNAHPLRILPKKVLPFHLIPYPSLLLINNKSSVLDYAGRITVSQKQRTAETVNMDGIGVEIENAVYSR